MTATDSLVFPDEIVTQALVRYLDIPGLPGEFALITLDNGRDHTRPSTLGPAALSSLATALDEIEAHVPRVTAIGVTGKPFVFGSRGCRHQGHGADQRAGPGQRWPSSGIRSPELFDSPVPTFAFLNGDLGGGLNRAALPLSDARSQRHSWDRLSRGVLGLLPGWRHAAPAPADRPAAAVSVIIDNALNQNRMLRADQAARLGLVDVLLADADFLAESLRWAARVVSGEVTVTRESHATDDWGHVVETSRAGLDLQLHRGAPAPYEALDLIAQARTTDLDSGTAAESDAVVDLVMSDEMRAGLYAFDLVQTRARHPVGAPAVTRPACDQGRHRGRGLMASQIAFAPRPTAHGSGRPDRRRPRPAGPGREPGASRDRAAARERPDQRRHRE